MSEIFIGVLNAAQEQHLRDIFKKLFTDANASTPQALYNAGLLYPDKKPSIADTLPDEWDRMMDEEGSIVRLADIKLEEYLEKWLRVLGHAYWVQGVWQDRVQSLTRLAEYTKDYVFAHAPGSREQKAAIAGSHPLYKEVLEELTLWERKEKELFGLIRKWEKIEFTISRTITNRGNRPSR